MLLNVRRIIHVVLTIKHTFTVRHVDMKRSRMTIMSISWLTVTCIILMEPIVMIMG